MNKPHPIRLKQTPIVEAIIELRFSTLFPAAAVSGMIYSALNEIYVEMFPLAHAEIPESIRMQAPEMMYLPLYRLVGNKQVEVRVGPKILSIVYHKHQNGSYPGWKDYIFKELEYVIEKVKPLGIINQVERVGIRTWDFFQDNNIFDNSELSLTMQTQSIHSNPLALDWIVTEDGFNNKISINNRISFATQDGIIEGSIIDIDTYAEGFIENFFDTAGTMIQKGHELNKKLFFDVLKKDYLDKYEPEYEQTEL